MRAFDNVHCKILKLKMRTNIALGISTKSFSLISEFPAINGLPPLWVDHSTAVSINRKRHTAILGLYLFEKESASKHSTAFFPLKQ